MKLKTILAVAATSIGLLAHADYADKVVSFEGMTADEAATKATLEADEAACNSTATWDLQDNTDVTVKAYVQGDAKFATRATQFTTLDIPYNKYLSVKTPLTNGIVRAASTTIDGEIFVDTLVKFTAVDVGDTVDVPDDAKVAVWVQAQDETDTPVNHIMVTAGSDKTVYDCGEIENLDAWHRLTIKVIGNVTSDDDQNGVVIYLDGSSDPLWCEDAKDAFAGVTLTNVAAEYKKNGQLFPAIANSATFNSVEFAGQGAIDDVVFTKTAEDFAKDPTVAELTFGTTIAKLYVNDGEETLTFEGSPAKFVYDGTKTYTYWYDAAAGYISLPQSKAKTLTGFDIEIDPADPAVAQIGTEKYSTVAAAITAATADQTVTLLVDAEETISIAKDGVAFTLDLAGNDIDGTVTVTTGTLTITNSTIEVGKVTGDVTVASTLTITAGIYDGVVSKDGRSAVLTVTGGAFLTAKNTNEDGECTLTAPEGFKFVAGTGGLVGYWVLDVKPIFEGAGTEADPYQIAIEDDLVKLADYTAKNDTTGVYFKQIADITLTEVITPIGADNNKENANKEGKADDFKAVAFKGIYDGDNKTISNVVLPRADYTGVFGSTFGATIKRLKVACAGFDSDSEAANCGGALIAGTTVKTTIEGCEVSGSATATKAIAGIVGYACEGTVVKDCVNKANLKSANEKVGGIIGCAQNGDAFGGKTVGEITVDGCTSEGNLECTTEGKTYVGGLVSYTDSKVVFKGANVVSGTLTQAGSTTPSSVIALNSGSVELDEGATFAVPAGIKTVTKNPVDGLIFATVNGNVATLVKKAALAFGNEYQVMATGASYTFAAAGSISFDTTLATPTVTAADGLVLSGPTGETAVKTWSARAYVPVTGVTLDITSTNVAPNATFTLTATVAPDGADDAEITWTTSDATIATVVNGEVTALADGKATIKATNAKTGIFASCEVTVKADGPVVPVGPGEVTPKGEENKATIAEAFGDNLAKWVEDVYGAGGAIPAAKLNATTPALIAAAKEFNLPIMTEAVTVTVEAAAEGFTFKIVDGEPINVQKANLQKLVKYTAELGTTAFGDSTDKVDFENNGTSFDAKFTTPDAAAGFMKVDMTAE